MAKFDKKRGNSRSDGDRVSVANIQKQIRKYIRAWIKESEEEKKQHIMNMQGKGLDKPQSVLPRDYVDALLLLYLQIPG